MATNLGRALAKDMVIYGLGDFVGRAVAFLAVPIYTRIFSPAEYGVLSFLFTASGLLLAIAILGGDSAYARYFFADESAKARGALTTTWLGFLALWSVVLTLVLAPWSSALSGLAFGTGRHSTLVLVTILTVPLILLNRMLGQVLRNCFRATAYVTFNIAVALLGLGLGLALTIGRDLGLLGILLGLLVAELVVLPVRLWATRDVFRRLVDVAMLRQLLHYGLPLVPVSLTYWVVLTSDRFLVASLADLTELGLYSLANSVAAILMLATGAIGQAWTPYALRLDQERPADAPRLYGQFLTQLLVAMCSLCVVFSAFAEDIVRLIASPEYFAAAEAVPPLVLGVVAYASTQVTAIGISLANRTSYLARNSAYAAALNVGLCVALIPSLGMIGAAWASTAAYTALTLLYFRQSQRLRRIEVERRRVASLLAATVAFTLGVSVLPLGTGLWHGMSKVAVCVAFLVCLALLRAIDSRDLQIIKGVLHRG